MGRVFAGRIERPHGREAARQPRAPLKVMRVLVVDHDSTVLEATVRALRDHFVIDAVTNKADCIDLLRQNTFDIVVACERLEDGSGLELLSQIAKRWPATLRVFAADRERLRLLQGRLGPFELFQALSYPINPEKLLSTLSLAREAHDADADTTSIQHIVLGGDDPTEPEPAKPAPVAATRPTPAPTPPRPVSRSQSTPERTPAPSRSAGRQPLAAPVSPARQHSAAPSRPPSVAVPASRFGRAPTRSAGELEAEPPPATRRRVTRIALDPSSADDAPVMSESLAEAAGIAAAARDRYGPAGERTPADRKAFVAGAACAIALLAIGLIVLKFGSKPRATPVPAAPAPVQAQFSQAVTNQVAAVESDFEQDNFKKAQTDIRKLQELAPGHPRLHFFVSLLDRNIKTRGALPARERAEALPVARSEAAAAARPESVARKSETAALAQSARANVSKSGSPRKAVAPTTAPMSSDTGARTPPESEDGPVFVAGAPTSSVPILRPASALPDTSSATPAPASTAAPASAVTASATTNAASASRAGQPISDSPPAASARPAPVATVEAQLTQRVPPQYPESALRNGVQGYVDVHFTITTDGTVTNVAVVSSDPTDVFNRAATDAVRQWRYQPRVVDGRPVESQSQVRLQFKLDSSVSH